MRAPGIVGTLQLAVVLALAAPLFVFGVDWLLGGRYLLGGTFVAIAALMLLMQWRLTNPFDPGDLAEIAIDIVVGDDE